MYVILRTEVHEINHVDEIKPCIEEHLMVGIQDLFDDKHDLTEVLGISYQTSLILSKVDEFRYEELLTELLNEEVERVLIELKTNDYAWIGEIEIRY